MDILEKLLLPFRGLFFATPAIIPGGGGDDGGTGDTGGGGGGEEEIPAGGEEEVVEETPEGEEVVEEEEIPADEEEIPEDEGEPGKAKGSAKPTVDQALNKLRKTDPKMAEVLRREHFQNLQYRNAGSIQEVQTMKDFMTLHGGEEEIGHKIAQGDRFADEMNMVAEGNPQIVKDIAADSPEGLMKLAPSFLSECQRIDPKRFGVMMAGPMARIMRETGVTPLMNQVSRFIKAGQQNEAFDAMAELLNWVGGVEALAEQSQEQPISQREKDIQAKDRAVQDKEYGLYKGEVGRASVTRTNSAISKHLTPLILDAKKRGTVLTLEQKQDLATGVYSEIAKSLSANKPYLRQMDAFYKRRAPADEIAEYVENKVAGLAEAATKAVWARKGWAGRFRKAAPGANGAGANRPGAVAFWSKPPEPENVDWSKDTDRAKWMGDGRVGFATLKNGKSGRFKW